MFCLTTENQKAILQVVLGKSYSKIISLFSFLKSFGCADKKKTKTKTCLSSNNQGVKGRGSLCVQLRWRSIVHKKEIPGKGVKTTHVLLGRQSSWKALYNHMLMD